MLDRIRVILVLPTAVMFSQPDWAKLLTGIAADYGIEVRLLLAEFNYDLERTPSVSFTDTLKPRRDMYLLKRYGLPALYRQGMFKARA